MIRTKNFLLSGPILLLVFLSQISLYGSSWTSLTAIGIVIFVSYAIVLMVIKKNFSIEINRKLIFLFIGLIFSSMISFHLIGKLKPVYVYGGLIMLFLSASIIGKYVDDIDRFIINIVIGISLLGLVIIILGLNKPFLGNTSFSFIKFTGFFTNPNNMGMFSAGLLHLNLGVLFVYYNK